MRVVAAVCAVSAFAFGAAVVGQQTVGASQPQLTATGSSFVGVAMSQWQGQYNELDGGDINFTPSSSVIGLNEFCAQTVDFAVTDISYGADLSNCGPSQVPYPFQYIPAAGGSLAFQYNLKKANGTRITDLVLNAPTIAGIFTGAISSWDDPTIQALNPTMHLPDEPITPYYRNDPTGENYLLSDYLVSTDPSLLAAFQQVATVPTPGASAIWAEFDNGVPTNPQFPNLHHLVPVTGADAASQGPLRTQGGISYVETAYAKNIGLPVASVLNDAGNAAQPTAEGTSEALQGAVLNADLTENLSGVFDATAASAYPLSGYSYFLVPCSRSLAAAEDPPTTCSGGQDNAPIISSNAGAEFGQFVGFVVCAGQTGMATLGYAPLPEQLVEQAFAAIGRIPGATEPPPPTATSCPNPTITNPSMNDSLSAVGPLFSRASVGRTTLTVSPQSVGDAWVLAVRVSNPSVSVSSITGGGVGGSWTKLAQISDATQNKDLEEWLGPIVQTNSPVITVQFSGPVSGTKVELDAREFSSPSGASTVWTEDTSANAANETASSTIAYPTLAPTSSGELYVGFSRASSPSYLGLTTPGFTYSYSAANNLYIDDPAVASSVSPVASLQRSGLSLAIGALIRAS